MNHAMIATEALRWRLAALEVEPRSDVAAMAAQVVSCGDPVVDSALRRLVSGWICEGLRPELLTSTWPDEAVRGLFVRRPELLDALDEMIGRAVLSAA